MGDAPYAERSSRSCPPPAFGLAYTALLVVAVRLLSRGLRPGWYPLHGRIGWQAWTVSQLMDLA
ncbi:hypothetical protein ACFVJW_08920 [Streptomyces libani]|uniref:Uncharacterized protein n=1 Tax=Streptomyces nigrescens TaxID=1920 RepID=A0A640TTH0_STRNI|nr:hypothetical protein Sliba_78260 [Streptomyces libani subsp. libani]GGV96324.1 hypothetical protein GCM10010500_38810 [Streptomyces libani subsp. libani]